MQLTMIDNGDLKHVCTERFQCFQVNMLDIGNILKITIKFAVAIYVSQSMNPVDCLAVSLLLVLPNIFILWKQ